MAYVRDLARETVAQIGLDSGYELAAQYISQSYQELCAHARFRHLRKLSSLYLPAPLGMTGTTPSGTFTVTLGSRAVVGDATASAALAAYGGAPLSLVGQWFRLQQGSVWYRIVRVDTTVAAAWQLILETPYASDNNAQGIFPSGPTSGPVNYYIIPRFINLAPEARTIGTVVCDAVYRPLEQISEDEMNLAFSSRVLVAFPPRWFAILGQNDNADGLPKQIEIYPWPVNSTTLHYTYWQHPPQLALDDLVPPAIDGDILREGAKRFLWSNAAGKAMRAGNLEMARDLRNEARLQQAAFNILVSRAVRNDRGGDDLKFILKASAWMRPRAPLDWDPITDAFQNFLARGV